MTLAPLSTHFNAAVLTMAAITNPAGFDTAAEGAPETLESVTAYYRDHGRLLIWEGASDSTIFGSPEVNHAFRAWHDSVHVIHQLPFDDEGEREVARIQAEQLSRRFATSPFLPLFRMLLEAEIVGQIGYAREHGEFPADQRAFVRSYLASVYGVNL